MPNKLTENLLCLMKLYVLIRYDKYNQNNSKTDAKNILLICK